MNDDSNVKQYVRKATNGIIHIASSKDWSSSIADSMLDAVDQRIIQLMNLQKAQEEMITTTQAMLGTKADNIVKDDKTQEIYLTSDGKEIGNRIKDECDQDGVPVVDLDDSSTPDNPDDSNKVFDDVLEF